MEESTSTTKRCVSSETNGERNKWGTNTHIVAAYSPWVNGLVEGTNKLFLHILKRLCTPDLDDESIGRMSRDDLPKNWPDHLEETI